MNEQEIIKELKKNNWLNGWYDFKEGDVMEIVNAEENFRGITTEKDITELFKYLYNEYNGIFRYKNLVFGNSWKYGCFVYAILQNGEIKEFEHLTISAFTPEKFNKFIERTQDIKTEEDIKHYFGE